MSVGQLVSHTAPVPLSSRSFCPACFMKNTMNPCYDYHENCNLKQDFIKANEILDIVNTLRLDDNANSSTSECPPLLPKRLPPVKRRSIDASICRRLFSDDCSRTTTRRTSTIPKVIFKSQSKLQPRILNDKRSSTSLLDFKASLKKVRG